MRLVRFTDGNEVALGLRREGGVESLSRSISGFPADLADVLRGIGGTLGDVLALAKQAPQSALLDADSLQFLPPIAKPGKIPCLGVNYLDHASEAGLQKPDHMVVFMRSGTSLGGNGQPLVRPDCSEQLDYEGELVAFIGTTGHKLNADQALGIVAGYAVFNDASIRDYQLRASQWTLGKNFDGTGIVGDFVPAEALPPGAKGLRLTTRLNGEVMQDADTSDMMFSVQDAIVALSEVMTLEPGDMIVMGTPGGVGLARNPPIFMKPGDLCEIEIEKIGTISNRIVAEAVAA